MMGPVGFEVPWKVVPMLAGAFVPPPSAETGSEPVVVPVQGIPSGRYAIEFNGPAPIRAIGVFRPPEGGRGPAGERKEP